MKCIPHWCLQSPEAFQRQPEGKREGAGSTDETALELQKASKSMKAALEEMQRRATKLEEVSASLFLPTHLQYLYSIMCAHTHPYTQDHRRHCAVCSLLW